ncbi:MAG TPA: reverse transcriptase-like protein [Candidatus Acidoferrales bacterium]
MTSLKRHKRAAHAPRLFADAERPADVFVAHVDGAARGNPGPASYGVVVRRPDGAVLLEMKKYVGVATNNVAEYFGLITALDYATSHGIAKLRVLSDSELLVRQMRGQYKVKSATLRPLHERARKLSGALAYFAIEHVPREQNREADRLANQALDETAGVAPRFDNRDSKPEARVRAKYAKGVLHPAEPLPLGDGEEVEITIHRRAR